MLASLNTFSYIENVKPFGQNDISPRSSAIGSLNEPLMMCSSGNTMIAQNRIKIA